MVRRRFPWFSASSLSNLTVLLATGLAFAQNAPTAKTENRPPSQGGLQDPVKRKAMIDKMIEAYDLTPHPPVAIPDNPPPHEGATILLPFVVEPPDLFVVEVMEALPGRPLSGERLVRPDGVISLGFYGEIPVKGLTLPQIKVAIIKQLRKFVDDETLGLEIGPEVEPEMDVPELPPGKNPFDMDEAPKVNKKTSHTSPSKPSPGRSRARVGLRQVARHRVPIRPIAARGTSQEPANEPVAHQAPPQINIPAGASGRITITIDVGGQGRPQAGPVPAGPGTPNGARVYSAGGRGVEDRCTRGI